jgi:hypothetical protein
MNEDRERVARLKALIDRDYPDSDLSPVLPEGISKLRERYPGFPGHLEVLLTLARVASATPGTACGRCSIQATSLIRQLPSLSERLFWWATISGNIVRPTILRPAGDSATLANRVGSDRMWNATTSSSSSCAGARGTSKCSCCHRPSSLRQLRPQCLVIGFARPQHRDGVHLPYFVQSHDSPEALGLQHGVGVAVGNRFGREQHHLSSAVG